MILHILKSTSGRGMKELILKSANERDKRMFHYAYDKSRMFHLKYPSINWNTVKDPIDLDFELLDLLITLYAPNSIAAREAVEKHCQQYGDLVKLICNKDLDCGVTATTANKIFGKGFIKVHQVSLATAVDLKDIRMPVVGQLKYNGVRVTSIIKDNKCTFYTRNGHTFEYPELAKILSRIKIFNADAIVLDGELTIGNSLGTNHTDVSGTVNSALKGNSIKGTPYIYNVFDYLDNIEFEAQNCVRPYNKRFEYLKDIVLLIDSHLVALAETYEFKTHEEIQTKFDEILALGGEGLILKRWDHRYAFKRSKDWIKMKAEKTADLECYNIQPGKDKYEGMIGALMCRGTVEGKKVYVTVGSGLNDCNRAWPEEHYLGHKIEILYNTLIQDKTTLEWSLFLPRFVKIRGDL